MTYGDIRDLLARLPHGDPHGATRYVHSDIFTVRHRLIAALDPPPTSVFEFGALYGYFLVTALDAAPSIYRVGWVDSELHTPNSNALCAANVIHARPMPLIEWWKSRDELHLSPFRQWDLVQVDADHTFDECLADLYAAEQLQPRWIFVDDYTAHPTVRDAVESFLEIDDRWRLEEHETVNGLAVLTRRP